MNPSRRKRFVDRSSSIATLLVSVAAWPSFGAERTAADAWPAASAVLQRFIASQKKAPGDDGVDRDRPPADQPLFRQIVSTQRNTALCVSSQYSRRVREIVEWSGVASSSA